MHPSGKLVGDSDNFEEIITKHRAAHYRHKYKTREGTKEEKCTKFLTGCEVFKIIRWIVG